MQLTSSGATSLRWSDDHDHLRASAYPLFLESHFVSGDWIVLADVAQSDRHLVIAPPPTAGGAASEASAPPIDAASSYTPVRPMPMVAPEQPL